MGMNFQFIYAGSGILEFGIALAIILLAITALLTFLAPWIDTLNKSKKYQDIKKHFDKTIADKTSTQAEKIKAAQDLLDILEGFSAKKRLLIDPQDQNAERAQKVIESEETEEE